MAVISAPFSGRSVATTGAWRSRGVRVVSDIFVP
jgi:hypothetical protein